MKRHFVTILILVFAGLTQGYAQQGILKGKITDKKTGEELVGAAIVVEGTTTGTITNFMGDYEMPPLEAGTYTFRCQYISYEPQFKEGIVIKADGETILNFEMGESELDLEEVTVVAKANRTSENFLMMEQKKAAVSKETIGAQQLSVQGVSDAASAATKITGVTKQEGDQTLNVRGLGDRYNTTTLNGLPLPSNHAEFKNINLELFSTDIIEFIGVEKVFTAPLYADVAGANVDIVSKKQNGNPFFQIKIKSGTNSNLSNADKFLLQDGPGIMGWNNFNKPTDLNVYSFENACNPQTKNNVPALGLAINGGTSFTLGEGQLHVFATASFDNEYGYSEQIQRRVNGSDDNRLDLAGEGFNYNTQSTGLINLNYSRKNTELFLNSMVLHSSAQDLKQLHGYIIDVVGDPSQEEAFLRRSDFERNLVMVNQLLGKHTLSDSWDLRWGVAYNTVANVLPDRRNNILVQESNGVYYPSTNDNANNHRYFHTLDENELAANITLSKTFGAGLTADASYRGKVSVGYSGRYKSRDFEAYQYNHSLDKSRVQAIDPENIDAYFNNERLQDGYFELHTFFGTLNIPSSYSGTLSNQAAFASIEYALTPKLLAVLGVRFENVYQDIKYKTSLQNGENSFNESNVFPSLSFKYTLNEKNNLRFSSSMSYTLPQFKETAPFLFEGITEATEGNPYLYPSKVYNAELKWELFPQMGQLISVAAFGKYIQDPINKFVKASASNDFTYANTGDWGYVIGSELELKKPLLETANNKLVANANLSLMMTKQELNNTKVNTESNGSINASFGTEEEELQGAAPMLANAGISYIHNWGNESKSITSTLVYGYTSDRLNLIGYAGLGNQIDKQVSNLDLVIKGKFNHLGIDFSAMNLLNPNIDRVQENANRDHVVMRYKRGVKFSLGLSYTF